MAEIFTFRESQAEITIYFQSGFGDLSATTARWRILARREFVHREDFGRRVDAHRAGSFFATGRVGRVTA